MPEKTHDCREGWVCEAHPDKAWEHDGCDGIGMPCQPSIAQMERDGGYPWPAPECGPIDVANFDSVLARV